MVCVEPVRELVSVLIKKGAVNRAVWGNRDLKERIGQRTKSRKRFFVMTSTAQIDGALRVHSENAKGS